METSNSKEDKDLQGPSQNERTEQECVSRKLHKSSEMVGNFHQQIGNIRTGPKAQIVHLIDLPNKSENILIRKWSNLDARIIQCTLAKVSLKTYLNCIQVSKHWVESEREFCTCWMNKNRNNWRESSFRNAMKNNINCTEIYWKSSEEWKRYTAPTLIRQMDTINRITHITMSNDDTLLAAIFDKTITIYDSMDLRMQFARDFKDFSSALYFNKRDSCMLVVSLNELNVVQITEGLPVLHTVQCDYVFISRPWWADNIFLSGNYDEKEDKTTFYLNAFEDTGNNNQYPILMVKSKADRGTISQIESDNMLICRIGKTKLGFKTFYKTDFAKLQNEENIQALDEEVDCEGKILDYTEVPDGNVKKLYILAHAQTMDYCFFVFDLDSFELKTSTLLIPIEFSPIRKLHSNEKYIACGSSSNCAYVWDLKSGLCIAQLKHEKDLVSCAIQTLDPQLVITAGYYDQKLNFWQLNTDKIK